MAKKKTEIFTSLETALARPDVVEALSLRSAEELCPDIAKLGNLRELKVWMKNVTHVPAEIGQLTSLEKLDLSQNEITELPDSIGELGNLKELELLSNPLTDLPSTISKLSKLKLLRLSGFRFTTIPEALYELTSLTELELSGHVHHHLELKEEGVTCDCGDFASLPARLFSLTALTNLHLNGNRTAAVPDEIGSLKNLKSLDLGNNRLVTIPASIGSLAALTSLKLSYNALQQVPVELGQLSKLKTLKLDNNPALRWIPPQIAELPSLSAAQKKALAPLLGKRIVQDEQLASLAGQLPTLSTLLTKDQLGSMFDYLIVNARQCSHDQDDYEAWIRALKIQHDHADDAALAGAIYDAFAKDCPGPCWCAVRSFTGVG